MWISFMLIGFATMAAIAAVYFLVAGLKIRRKALEKLREVGDGR